MSRPTLPLPVKVGDILIRVSRNREEEVKVARVGRKYLFVKLYGDREYAYRLIDGYAREGVSGWTDRVATREMLDAEQRHQDALARLRDLGWERKGYSRSTEKIETLEAMVRLLEQDGETS